MKMLTVRPLSSRKKMTSLPHGQNTTPELYNHKTKGDPSILVGQELFHEDNFPTMCEEVVEAI